tara:strand:- start:6286 stop:6585 length:300 start_codon:yes stop_codon:yes gene_type:complete
MFEWLISLVPWWAWALAAVAAVVAVQVTFGWKAAMGAAIGLLPVLGLLYGRKQGAEAERAKRDRQALDHIAIRKETDDEIDQIGHADVDERLSRWNRDE